MAFYLGLDAGGTKTECALADDERIVARAVGGCIKPLRVPAEEAERESAVVAGADRAGLRRKHAADRGDLGGHGGAAVSGDAADSD